MKKFILVIALSLVASTSGAVETVSVIPVDLKVQEVVILACVGRSSLPDEDLSAKKKRTKRIITVVETTNKDPRNIRNRFELEGCLGKPGDVFNVSY
jgi:hypothetical protein